MILLLVSTNRKNAMSAKVAHYYEKLLKEQGEETLVLLLEQLPTDFAFSALYENSGKHPHFQEIQQLIDAVQKIVFIVPEYNGSFPGVLKTFIDALRYPDSFVDKKIALIGISAGVQGNAIGLSHLGDILSYLKANVLGLRVQLGQIHQYYDGQEFSHNVYKDLLALQAKRFVEF